MGGFARGVLHVPGGRRPLDARAAGGRPARRGAHGGRRPRIRVRQGAGEVAAARAQPLGDHLALLSGPCWSCSCPRCGRPRPRCSRSPRPAAGCRRSWRERRDPRALPRLVRERQAIQAAARSRARSSPGGSPPTSIRRSSAGGRLAAGALGAAGLLARRHRCAAMIGNDDVTAVIAHYNYGRFLPEAVESLRGQAGGSPRRRRRRRLDRARHRGGARAAEAAAPTCCAGRTAA